MADPSFIEAYPFQIDEPILNWHPVVGFLVHVLKNKVSVEVIVAKFHNGLADLMIQVCQNLFLNYIFRSVSLSGGVWQNMSLLRKSILSLSKNGFNVLTHQQLPPNDGGSPQIK